MNAQLPGPAAPDCALRQAPTGTAMVWDHAMPEARLPMLWQGTFVAPEAKLREPAILRGLARALRIPTAPTITPAAATGPRGHAMEAAFAIVRGLRGMAMIPARRVPVSRAQAIGG